MLVMQLLIDPAILLVVVMFTSIEVGEVRKPQLLTGMTLRMQQSGSEGTGSGAIRSFAHRRNLSYSLP